MIFEKKKNCFINTKILPPISGVPFEENISVHVDFNFVTLCFVHCTIFPFSYLFLNLVIKNLKSEMLYLIFYLFITYNFMWPHADFNKLKYNNYKYSDCNQSSVCSTPSPWMGSFCIHWLSCSQYICSHYKSHPHHDYNFMNKK